MLGFLRGEMQSFWLHLLGACGLPTPLCTPYHSKLSQTTLFGYSVCMSGHNKWTQIKRKKELTDAKKSKIFTKIVRLIGSEARLAKGDTNSPGLRAAIEKAKEANMPAENIERAVRKASEPSANLESITYEAYGPAGVGIIIEVLTDNRNRTAPEIKHILSRNGFALAAIGSVTWAFAKEHPGADWVPNSFVEVTEEDARVLDQLIDEVEENDDVQTVFTNAQ